MFHKICSLSVSGVVKAKKDETSPNGVVVANQSGHGQPLETDQQAPTLVREKTTVGRNEPCPCGSGKKFKKCCLKG